MSLQTQQLVVDMRVRGISNLLPQAIRAIGAPSGQREQSWPKHNMTEGIMMLAEDKRPEATLLIGLS